MNFNEKLPEWHKEGIEPPASKKQDGWSAGDKPPAEWLNWLFNRAYKALKELQDKSGQHLSECYYVQPDEPMNTNANTIWFKVNGEINFFEGGLFIENAETSDFPPVNSNIWFRPI